MALRAAFAALALSAAVATPAAAQQDCPRAGALPDRLICANEAVRNADQAMVAAYRGLRERLDGAARERLLDAQRDWLALRNRACESRIDWEDQAAAECIVAMTERRRAALAAGRFAGELIVGPTGSPRLAVETRVLGAPRQRCTVVVRLPHFADADARSAAFDAGVRRAVLGNRLVGCERRNREMPYHDFDVDFAVTWASARVLAIAFTVYLDPGNGHPELSIASVAMDLARGRIIERGDVVAGDDGMRDIAELCYESIKQEFGVGDDEIDRPQFDRLVRDFDAWTIAPERITITFPRYSILGGVAPGGDCTLPVDEIRPHLRADNPLWSAR